TISVLTIEYQPWWDRWGALKPANVDASKSWGGLMRYLGAGYADQSQAKYLEIWINPGPNRRGVLYIDLGKISEDVIPNGRLDTEDRPRPGFQTGNGILDPGEDVGLDGISGIDPADSSYINGSDLPKLPSWDDFHYSFTDRSDYSRINGSEGNGSGNFLEGGNFPDTEDLNNNGYLDTYNDFFRYRIDLSDEQSRYIVGGKNNPKGWRLYRIPLTDTLMVGHPRFTEIEYARIWFSEFSERAAITIAQMEIVGNEWREISAVDEAGRVYNPVSVAVVNTHDNPEYGQLQPPGVAGAIDPVTGLRAKEQSLVIQINRLGTGETGAVYKSLPQGQAMNLTEYRRLKMFVRGGGWQGSLKDRMGRDADLEMFIRFGEDSSSRRPRYYEYAQRLHEGWSKENEIDVALEKFAALKFLRDQDSTRNWDVLPNGDVIRVVGDPSLRNIRFWMIGIKNHGQPLTARDGIEMWVDELRVSDIKQDPGWAATGGITIQGAKFFNLRADLRHQQADFHNLNQRISSDQSDRLSGTASLSLNLDQFFPSRWGVQLPLRGDFRQDVSVPKYKSNSDIPLSALGGGGKDAWEIFTSSLNNRKRFSVNPAYTSPVDSLSSVRKSYSLSLNYSKTRRSEFWLTKLTLDRLRIGTSYSENWSSDWRDLYTYGYQKRGTVGYDFGFEKPWEISWLKWASFIPWLGPRIQDSRFRPLPQSFTLSADGTETHDARYARSGVTLPPSYRFTITGTFGLGWRPWDWWGGDWRRAVSSGRIPEDSTRHFIVSRLAFVDSSRFRIETDTGTFFDTLSFQQARKEEIKRLEDRLFWNLFNYHFVDNQLSESYSFQFMPRLISWLGTDANYRSNYNWNWSSTYGPGDRSVSSSSNLSTNLTFRLPQLVSPWRISADKGDKEKKGPDQISGKDLGKLSGEGQSPPPQGEILSPLALPEDTVRKIKPPPAPWILLKGLISKLGDISYNYTLSRDYRNYAVAEGQARWEYRLGFNRDPGLATVPGFVFRNSFSRRQDHRFTTNLTLTPKLAISGMEYQIISTHNEGQQESGSFTRTIFPYFGSDGKTIRTLPIVNYSIRWSGWEKLPGLDKLTNSVSLDHTFRGEMTDQWIKVAPDSLRRTLRMEYSKNYSPLLGINFNWKWGFGTSVRYNRQTQISDERTGAGVKNRSLTNSITLQGSYTAQTGIRIPLVLFPTLRLRNQTTFSLSYTNQLNRRESSAGNAPFSLSSESASWSISPQMEYTFSDAVRGGFRYAYNVQRNLTTGRTRSQEFSFRVNIIIRG
ncbi:MAG: cell surface protein SprA, partial [bacterium]